MAMMASRLFQSEGQKLPSPQPSPGGRGGRTSCLAGYVDLEDFGDYGFGDSGGCVSRSGPHPSPLPEGEGADRGVLRGTSTWKILVIMVLVKGLRFGFVSLANLDSMKDVQVGVTLEYPRIGSLYLWERARVRGFRFGTTKSQAWPTAGHLGCGQIPECQS